MPFFMPEQVYSADWIFPISSKPIRGGTIIIEDRKIKEVISEPYKKKHIKHLQGALLPGFVNAHTHLELGGLEGKLEATYKGLGDWMKRFGEMHRNYQIYSSLDKIRGDIAKLKGFGIVAIGDIYSSELIPKMLANEKIAGIAFKQYVDGLGMREADLEDFDYQQTDGGLKFSIAPHSLYSTSKQLIEKIFTLNSKFGRKTTIHWNESKDETLFCKSHEGIIDRLLRDIWPDIREKYKNIMSEEEFVKTYFNKDTIIVHTAESNPLIFSKQFNQGVNVVLCPRSNIFISGRYPNVDELYRLGVQFALGTDSLASVADLDIRKEVACIKEISGNIPPEYLLKSLTLYGARTLGIDNTFGTLEPGKSARISHISFKNNGQNEDIEEFIVDNIEKLPIRVLNY